jgi:hypothetical protein
MVDGWIRAANGMAGVTQRSRDGDDGGIPPFKKGRASSSPQKLSLTIGSGVLRLRLWADSGGIEDVGFGLAFVALNWDFFAV